MKNFLSHLRKKAAKVTRSVVPLAFGEGIARICNLGVIVFISRRLGVEALGIYALGQNIVQYVMTGSDLGLKYIGARLVAVDPSGARATIWAVEKKRIGLAAIFVPLAWIYSYFGPVPHEARKFLCAFTLSVIPATFSLDWVLWGMERFKLLGLWRAGVALLFASITLTGLYFMHSGLMLAAWANACSMFVLVVALWIWLGLRLRLASGSTLLKEISDETRWASVAWLGLAVISNQAFNTIDSLMLGAISTSSELGFYNAAYRLLFLVLGLYYLLTQTIFPGLAKKDASPSGRRFLSRYLVLIFAVGLLVTLAGEFSSGKIIQLFYGEQFHHSARLLRVLLLAVPLDFTSSFIGIALAAWGQYRLITLATGIAALVNVGLNWVAIPREGAYGAAWVTNISYLVLLGMLLIFWIRHPFGAPQRVNVETAAIV